MASTDPLISELEVLVPDMINMVVAYEAPELATVAQLIETLGVAVADAIAQKGPVLSDQIKASDLAALTALKARFHKV